MQPSSSLSRDYVDANAQAKAKGKVYDEPDLLCNDFMISVYLIQLSTLL